MATVTEIREIRGLTAISLDGSPWLYLTKRHFHKEPLETGCGIDPEAYIDRMAQLQYRDCYEAALTQLDRSIRTKEDLRRTLMRKGYVEPAATAAVDRLEEIGLINDMDYAQRFAKNQSAKPVGAYAVRRKLRAKQFSEEAVETAMEEFDDEQQLAACREAAAALFRKYAQLPQHQARAKLSQALARRGFLWDTISSCIDEFPFHDDPFDN